MPHHQYAFIAYGLVATMTSLTLKILSAIPAHMMNISIYILRRMAARHTTIQTVIYTATQKFKKTTRNTEII